MHFLAMGALVFVLFHFAARGSKAPESTIVVSGGRIEQLAIGFTRTWHRSPTEQELDGLVEDYIREEVLYREALAMGLDKNDTIVRRRMRQKLEFLTEDATAAVSPTDQDLQRWLDKHSDKFRAEPQWAFRQIYFSADRHGESGTAAASNALARLTGAGKNIDASQLGDATLLPHELPLSRLDEIASAFGDEFAQAITHLESGRWAGPVQSGYGWHLVYVSEHTAGRPSQLADVHEAVQREWLAARRREIVDSTYSKWREKYVVVVDAPSRQADIASQSVRRP